MIPIEIHLSYLIGALILFLLHHICITNALHLDIWKKKKKGKMALSGIKWYNRISKLHSTWKSGNCPNVSCRKLALIQKYTKIDAWECSIKIVHWNLWLYLSLSKHQHKCNMTKVQHEKRATQSKQHKISAIRKRATWKKFNRKRVKFEKSATWKGCNTKKVQREYCKTWKECNTEKRDMKSMRHTKKVKHEKRAVGRKHEK